MDVTAREERKKSGFSIYRRLGGEEFYETIERLEQLQIQFPGLELRLPRTARRQPAIQLVNSKEIQRIRALRSLEPAIALRGIFRANPALLETRPIRFNSIRSTGTYKERYFMLQPSEEDARYIESLRKAIHRTLAGMVETDFDIPTRTLDATIAYSGRGMRPVEVDEVLGAVSVELPVEANLLGAKSTL